MNGLQILGICKLCFVMTIFILAVLVLPDVLFSFLSEEPSCFPLWKNAYILTFGTDGVRNSVILYLDLPLMFHFHSPHRALSQKLCQSSTGYVVGFSEGRTELLKSRLQLPLTQHLWWTPPLFFCLLKTYWNLFSTDSISLILSTIVVHEYIF